MITWDAYTLVISSNSSCVMDSCYFIPQLYEFYKNDIPEEREEEAEFADKLSSFGISLQPYKAALEMENLTMYVSSMYIAG